MRTVVVDSLDAARELAQELDEWSLATGWPVGLDTEFTGWNTKQSPIGNAKLWCTTLAWGEPRRGDVFDGPSDFDRAFIPARFTAELREWLAEACYPKVGTNIFSIERHVLAEAGFKLNGIEGDTLYMSRLLDPATKPGHADGHGLKEWGARLGYNIITFDDVCGRQGPGAIRTYKKDRSTLVDHTGQTPGWHPKAQRHYLAGAEVQNINKKRIKVDIDVAWLDYPNRRSLIIDYATQDAAMSLDAYWDCKALLEGRSW